MDLESLTTFAHLYPSLNHFLNKKTINKDKFDLTLLKYKHLLIVLFISNDKQNTMYIVM